jgi:hypothetical protein
VAVTILICNSTLTPLLPVDNWTAVDSVVKFNATGSGSFTAPADPALVTAATTPGNRVVLLRDGVVFSSGPIEGWDDDWQADKHGLKGLPDLTVRWADNTVLLARHITYPDPTAAATAQTTVVAYTATGVNAETVMRSLVNLNAGPGALAARQEPHLQLGVVAGVGTNINESTRFEPLTDVLRRVALAGGGLGFRVREDMHLAQLYFEVYTPSDRSASIRFSRQLNNVRAVKATDTAPSCTAAIVGGDGTGTSRQVVERLNVSGWGRWETFVNQAGAGGSDVTEQQQAGDKALVDGGETIVAAVTAVDTATQKFGVNFFLGDKVSVQAGTGVQVVDVVSSAHLFGTPADGVQVQPAIGLDTGHKDNQTIQTVRAMERRLNRLEGS